MWRSFIQMAKSRPQFDWKTFLQSVNFELFKYRFLNPKEGEASRVTCPNAKGCDVADCTCREVRFIGGRLVAYCREKYSEPRLALSERDIQYLGINYAKFHFALSEVLGLEFLNHDLDNEMFWEIGTLRHGPGNRIPVYLSYYTTRALLRAKLQLLLAQKFRPFAVIAADRMVFPQEMLSVLDKEGCSVVFLHDAVTLNADTTLTVSPETLMWLNGFKRSGKVQSDCVYRTAPGTTWHDIHLKCRNASSLSVWMRTDMQPVTVSSVQLGLHNTRKDCPSLAFSKLLDFLNAPNRSLQCFHRGSKEQNDLQHRVREINTAFKIFFPDIDTPVIELMKTGGYFMLNASVAQSSVD